jgi:hypothetical protein
MKKIIFITTLLFLFQYTIAQSVAINTTAVAANSSAMLDVASTTKGMLIPRMTQAQKNAIATPATGLLIYQTDNTPGFYYYNGAAWVQLGLANNDFWTTSNGLDIYKTNTRHVGIGTTVPLARLHVADSSVLFSATGDVPGIKQNTPISGAGRRMMWYSDKAAFRAGYVDANQWDSINIGNYSSAFGYRNSAAGLGSFVTGASSSASGTSSFATGNQANASGNNSFAQGYRAFATGESSVAMGWQVNATGSYSFVAGQNNTALGNTAAVFGNQSYANGNASFAMGSNDSAKANYSIAIGNGSETRGIGSLAMGNIATTIGDYSFAAGSLVTAGENYSAAFGINTSTKGFYSFAAGSSSEAIGAGSVSMGQGNFAIGATSQAFGALTKAEGFNSSTFGLSTKSKSYNGFVIGQYNDSTVVGSSSTFNINNRIFQIGNGTADNARSNVITVLQSGDVGVGTTAPNALLHLRTADWIKTIYENDIGQARGYIGADNNGTITYSTNMYWNGSSWVHPNSGSALGILLHRLNNRIEFRVKPDPGSLTTAMYIQQNANVGIGGTTANHKLHVYGDVRSTDNIMSDSSVWVDFSGQNNGSKEHGLRLGEATTGEAIASKRTNGGNKWGIDFYAQHVPRMSITNTGLVGIGTTTPATKFHIFGGGANNQIRLDDTLNTRVLRISNDGGGTGPYIGTSTNHNFSIVTNNNVRATFTNDGKVGIGVTNPTAALDVNGKTYTDSLQVGGGSVISKIIKGEALVGSWNFDQKALQIFFPPGFTQVPQFFVTPVNDAFNISDVFSVVIKEITTAHVWILVQRVDAGANGGGWGQPLRVHWMAVQ